MKKLVLGAAIGNCVHVAGVAHFLRLAEDEGMDILYLGPAVEINDLEKEIVKHKPDIIGVSYRLTPENAVILLEQLKDISQKLDYKPQWVFGGTEPVAKLAKKIKLFDFISDGYDDINDSINFLRGKVNKKGEMVYPNNIIERIESNYPYPVLRHHFGLPTIKDTIKGIEDISRSKVVDVVSIGTDQNAQEFFFNASNMKTKYDGAGGVPIRTREQFNQLKKATNYGNKPLIRCYSGTADVFKYAEMLIDEIDNAWTAIPLFWYSELDGRGPRTIEVSIKEAQELIKWHAEKGLPVEINEPHHWSMRDAHDVISVITAYISAYNAKKLGVKNYIAQYMFNVPNGTSFTMDYARILAMRELVESLHDNNFKSYRQVRAGLPLFNADEDIAKGQLASTTFVQMALKPHIIHVVGYCEGNHIASPKEVVESCKIVKGVIKHTLSEGFNLNEDKEVIKRKDELIKEAKYVLEYIENKYEKYDDPLCSSEVLADCVKKGIIDAVHILKNDKFKGKLETKIINGKCEAYDKIAKRKISEKERLEAIERDYE